MLLSVLSDDEHGRDDVWRHLLSLNRTLKVSDPCPTVIADYHGISDKPSDTVQKRTQDCNLRALFPLSIPPCFFVNLCFLSLFLSSSRSHVSN